MPNAIYEVPLPANEPIHSYAPGTEERTELKASLKELAGQQIEIPLIIGGKEIRTGGLGECRMPHNHKKLLGTYHKAGAKEIRLAIKAAAKARKEWATMPWEARASVLLKAAELLAGPHRMTVNAATMLGQSKNPLQAEIDSACELIDFWRFNPLYYQQILEEQPFSAPGINSIARKRTPAASCRP